MSAKATFSKIVSALENRFGGLRSLNEARPLDQLILLVLSEGHGDAVAKAAFKALKTNFVDWNEVRVSPLHDLRDAIGPGTNEALAGRPKRIRDLLALVYSRQNRVDLDFLLEKGDRQAQRARERLISTLAEISPGLPAMMSIYLDGKEPTVVFA
ncbi:MAG: hypothetical protein KDB53_21295, partial [Planctomycetes bacterium]|nr:hypothetical protein [Planctomycetota bacterium]